MRGLLAKAGTVIHSKNGAVFATVVNDLYRGAVARRGDFQYADGHIPQFGQSLEQPIVDFLYGVSPPARGAA